jgi:hypothetical protein
MKIFGGNKITGGTASRAEVYGLFIAAVVLLGGGGAVAYSASGGFSAPPSPEISESATPSASPLETQEPDTGSTGNDSNTGATNNNGNTNTNTSCESAYWDSVRAAKQAQVDWYQSQVNDYASYVKSDKDQLTAHRNGLPTEPIRIQIDNDVFELTGLELEAFLENRINNNSSQLASDQKALNIAIAELKSVPTC